MVRWSSGSPADQRPAARQTSGSLPGTIRTRFTARQFWAARIPAGTNGSGEVIIVDPANNRAVIVAGNDVWLVDYTPADRLQIDSGRVRILTFKEAPNR